MTLTIRRVRESDVSALASVLEPDVSAKQVNHRWQEHREGYREMLVAELGGEVAGTVSSTTYNLQLPDSLRMLALDVGFAFRRRGVGTALARAVEAKAHSEFLNSVNLEVALENAVALRLYERLGYCRLGEPVVNRWTRLTDDGRCEQVEERSWVMVKELELPFGTLTAALFCILTL